jgi:hypothetical protein
MNDQDRIAQFVDLFLKTMGATSAPGVPPEMKVDAFDESEWTAWRPIPSRITPLELEQIEASLGFALPNLFRCYLLHRCLLMTDLGLIALPEIRSDRPLEDLLRYVQVFRTTSFLQIRRFFPFATDSRTGDLLCFDVNVRDPNQAPIYLVDPERLTDETYEPPLRNPSFASLLDELEVHLRSYV